MAPWPPSSSTPPLSTGSPSPARPSLLPFLAQIQQHLRGHNYPSTIPQLLALLTIHQQPGIYISELGRQCRISQPGITQICKRLRQAEAIRTRRDPEDDRRVLCYPCPHPEIDRILTLAREHHLI